MILPFPFYRGGQRDREGETRDPRATDQLHENGRHKESLGDDQPAGETGGSTGGQEGGDSWNSFEIVHGNIALVFELVGPSRVSAFFFLFSSSSSSSFFLFLEEGSNVSKSLAK